MCTRGSVYSSGNVEEEGVSGFVYSTVGENGGLNGSFEGRDKGKEGNEKQGKSGKRDVGYKRSQGASRRALDRSPKATRQTREQCMILRRWHGTGWERVIGRLRNWEFQGMDWGGCRGIKILRPGRQTASMEGIPSPSFLITCQRHHHQVPVSTEPNSGFTTTASKIGMSCHLRSGKFRTFP